MHAPRPAPRLRRRVDGVLLLDKAVGLSSNAALQQVKRLYRAEKAGHTGTLDPLASGLLPICFGEATKFAHMLLDADKTYAATVRLGVTTTTGDTEGEVLETCEVTVGEGDVQAILPRFIGRLRQIPPRYAALKYQGRNYYEYAREGIEIPRPAREIVVSALRVDAYSPPNIELTIRCSKGTYVRVLAEDIGAALGCGAHLAALRRLETGGLMIGASCTLETLGSMSEGERDAVLFPSDTLVAPLPRIELDDGEAIRFVQGQALQRERLPDGAYSVYATGIFVGVALASDGTVRPRRLIVNAASVAGSNGAGSPVESLEF